MERPLETLYGLGRLAFGAGLLAAPEPLGQVLMGKEARKPAVRTMFRFYGTRDTVLGLGTLRAVSRGSDVQRLAGRGHRERPARRGRDAGESAAMPPEKRVPGIAAALGAAAAGVALLARSERRSRLAHDAALSSD